MRNFKIYQLSRKIDLAKLRSQKNYTPIKKPYCPYKARMYGYRALKNNFLITISRIKKGGIECRSKARGRTPSKIYPRFSRNISLRNILSNRLEKKYKNTQLYVTYYLCQDGQYKYFQSLHKIINKKNLSSTKLS